MKTLFAALLITLATGCTTTTQVAPDQYVVACGAAGPWSTCQGKAHELCPTGYETLQQVGGFNRKELYIKCPT